MIAVQPLSSTKERCSTRLAVKSGATNSVIQAKRHNRCCAKTDTHESTGENNNRTSSAPCLLGSVRAPRRVQTRCSGENVTGGHGRLDSGETNDGGSAHGSSDGEASFANICQRRPTCHAAARQGWTVSMVACSSKGVFIAA